MSKLETKEELLQEICNKCCEGRHEGQEITDARCDDCMVSELVEELCDGNE